MSGVFVSRKGFGSFTSTAPSVIVTALSADKLTLEVSSLQLQSGGGTTTVAISWEVVELY